MSPELRNPAGTAARNTYIDFVRGVGILLVVIGHLTSFDQYGRQWIYSFHMPLFFLLSGLFFRAGKSFPDFFRRKVRTLFVPFAFFLFLDVCISFFKQLKTDSFWICVKTSVVSALLNVSGVRFRTWNSPIWFLFVLFVLQILLFFLSKNRRLLCFSAAASVLLTVCLQFFDTPRRLLYTVAVPAYGFFAAGYLFGTQLRSLSPAVILRKMRVLFIVLFVLWFAQGICAISNGIVDMIWLVYGNSIVLFYLNGVSGCLLILLSCSLPYRFKPLRRIFVFFGKNTIYILVTHYYLTKYGIPFVLEKLGLASFGLHPLTEVIATVFVMLCMVPAIYLCRRFLFPIFGIPKQAAIFKK